MDTEVLICIPTLKTSECVYVLFPKHNLSRDNIFDPGEVSKSSNKKFQLMLVKTLEVSHISIVYNRTKVSLLGLVISELPYIE